MKFSWEDISLFRGTPHPDPWNQHWLLSKGLENHITTGKYWNSEIKWEYKDLQIYKCKIQIFNVCMLVHNAFKFWLMHRNIYFSDFIKVEIFNDSSDHPYTNRQGDILFALWGDTDDSGLLFFYDLQPRTVYHHKRWRACMIYTASNFIFPHGTWVMKAENLSLRGSES